MKITDLSIGNYIAIEEATIEHFKSVLEVDLSGNPNIYRVTEITGHEICAYIPEVGDVVLRSEDISPVPVTEKTLEALGFECVWDEDEEDHVFFKEIDDSCVIVQVSWLQGGSFDDPYIAEIDDDYVVLHIEGIHELQQAVKLFYKTVELKLK